MPLSISITSNNKPILQDLAVRFFNDDTAFAADKVFPVKGVPTIEGSFPIWVPDHMRKVNMDRAPGAVTNQLPPQRPTMAAYKLADLGLKVPVIHKDYIGQPDPLASIASAAMAEIKRLVQATRVNLEDKFVTKALNAANYPAANQITVTGTKWASTAYATDNGGKPYDDIVKAKQATIATCGNEANSMFISNRLFNVLRAHPDIQGRMLNTNPGQPTVANAEAIQALFGLKKLIIGSAVYNSAADTPTQGLTGTSLYAQSAATDEKVVVWYEEPLSDECHTYGALLYLDASRSEAKSKIVDGINAPPSSVGSLVNLTTWDEPDPQATVLRVEADISFEFIARDSNGLSLAGAIITNPIQ